jgi:chloramphenicol 3-O phosphotransferase
MHNPDGLTVRNGVIGRGDEFLRIFAGFRAAVAALARSGIDLLVDDVMQEGAIDQQMWNDSLRGLDVCWVGVKCAPDIAAAREAARGDRPPGIARQHALTVHDGVRYDLEIDAGVLDIAESVELVRNAVRERWSVRSDAAANDPPALPTLSAWTASAPWESRPR